VSGKGKRSRKKKPRSPWGDPKVGELTDGTPVYQDKEQGALYWVAPMKLHVAAIQVKLNESRR